MAKGNNETLTAEQEMQLRQPIEDYVGNSEENRQSQSGRHKQSSRSAK